MQQILLWLADLSAVRHWLQWDPPVHWSTCWLIFLSDFLWGPMFLWLVFMVPEEMMKWMKRYIQLLPWVWLVVFFCWFLAWLWQEHFWSGWGHRMMFWISPVCIWRFIFWPCRRHCCIISAVLFFVQWEIRKGRCSIWWRQGLLMFALICFLLLFAIWV